MFEHAIELLLTDENVWYACIAATVDNATLFSSNLRPSVRMHRTVERQEYRAEEKSGHQAVLFGFGLQKTVPEHAHMPSSPEQTNSLSGG